MSMASWPGGLPSMGYMAPLQGVVSMEGGAVAPGHIPPPLFTQPRPKRCATHCHIARNILYLQQFMKMNSFWPAPAAAPASLFGSKPCNLNAIPGADMHGSAAVRGGQDKGLNVAKEKGGSQPATTPDSAQRKPQILIQQPLPPVAPSNLLGPTFIFPLNQQQTAAPRPGGAKSPAAGGVSSNASASAVTSSSSAAAVSFNYPNMASNETQYLAIVQNNGYSFPIPAAAVGAPPNYRGNPAQAVPLFNNGPFYSSQMIHPSQLQSIQSQFLHANQNASASSGSSASQKHLQSQQQRNQSGSGGVSSGSGSAGMQNMPSQKTQPSQQSNNQYQQQSRPRQHEGEQGREEDSPWTTTTDARGSRASVNIYGQNFAMPIHPPNFGLMTHPTSGGGGGANHGSKKGHQPQQTVSKTGPESLPAHGFAMTFGTMNGASSPGIDISSMAQNLAMFQNQAAAAAAVQKNFRVSDDGKSGGADSSATDDERKSLTGKVSGGGGQSIAFTRPDMADGPVSSNSVNANAAASGAARSSRSMASNPAGGVNVRNAHNIQAQIQQQHLMQLKQMQQQQQMAANAVGRSKVAVNGNGGGMYSEHLSSSPAMASKFPNAISGFPQNLVQSSSSSSPSQSPQWKASGRTSTPSLASSTTTATTTTPLKSLPQQHSRAQPPPMHTQISFGGNQKPPAASQGQSNNQTTSSPMMVGSPTTSSVSKGASGSPRTTSSAATNNKTGQASSLSAQPAKNSPSVVPNQKSPSILGNPSAAAAAAGSVTKSQLQQQMPKAMQQQQQLFFSNPYSQSQSPHSSGKSSAPSGATGYYMTRRQTDQHQQPPVTSGGGLSLCPPITLSGANTNDPATAIAAATANAKGGGLPSQGIIHAPQFAAQPVLPAGFSYAHPVPAAVPVKPAEQKQPAGNDNLHPWQPEKK